MPAFFVLVLLKKRKKILLVLLGIFLIGFIVPQKLQMPVEGATTSDYHPDSFWFHPWGRSVTHKGVDIFAKKGTTIKSATAGIVLYVGKVDFGGNVILVLGPQWRLHYYAHLEHAEATLLSLVVHQSTLGTVGNSGNAASKPPHLHYAIFSLIPYFWQIDDSIQGWKKMFYLNPTKYLQRTT